MRYARVVMLLALLAIVACSRQPQPGTPAEGPGTQIFVGLASYYGFESDGRTMASGSKYDPNAMTAAHRTLPFGTRVLVTNLDNDLSVVVEITDRGPQRKDRLIDLSFSAAKELNMLTSGVVKVKVEVVNE